jgi:hypothetical protein
MSLLTNERFQVQTSVSTETTTQNTMTTPQVTARAKPRIPQSTEKPKTTNVRQQQLSQNQSLKLKVVVRGLPPNLPESKFNETAAEWINENTVDWSYYVTGKLHER